MVNPCPGYSITTPYRKQGSWSCSYHTGVDFACPTGTRLVAAISGVVRHRNHGSALGNHQFSISPDPGQPFADGEVFYAHTRTRLADGTRVNAGDFVAECGVEGNTTGPHLHFEYHPHCKACWGCEPTCDNPQVVIDHQPGGSPSPPPVGGPTTSEEDDMLIIYGPNRQANLVGAGYAKTLSDEEFAVLKDLGIRVAEHNDRGFDVARGACLHGDATD